MEEVKLDPCPHCGNIPYLFPDGTEPECGGYSVVYKLECLSCKYIFGRGGVAVKFDTRSKFTIDDSSLRRLVKRWNDRV